MPAPRPDGQNFVESRHAATDGNVFVLDPNRKPMPPERWAQVKAQVRENMRLIRIAREKKRLQQQGEKLSS